MKKKMIPPWIYVGVILIIIYIPIAVTVVYSFNASKISSIWGGFSLSWYRQLFRDRTIGQALINSLVLAFFSCLFAVLIGTSGALGMRKLKNRVNGIIAYLSLMPLMIPEIILGMVFLAAFSFLNLPFGMVTLVIAHTTFCVPYVFMTVKARLEGMDDSIEEAAMDLGATGFRVFWDVTLPAILPAIASGVLLSFAASFDDVVISIFVTGATVNTLPINIYSRMKTGVTPEINALATVLLLATILIVAAGVLVGRIGRGVKKENKL